MLARQTAADNLIDDLEVKDTLPRSTKRSIHQVEHDDANQSNDVSLIPLTWVLSTKTRVDGTVEQYKARLVSAGNQQPIAADEVNSAPTTDQPIVKILLSVALKQD